MDRVRESSTTADKEKIESGGGNILIHHSRDTAEKQWAETWVLTLAGVARIFNTRRYLLQPLGRYTFFFFLRIQVINVKGNLENTGDSLKFIYNATFQEESILTASLCVMCGVCTSMHVFIHFTEKVCNVHLLRVSL